jgi:hypothetical protein
VRMQLFPGCEDAIVSWFCASEDAIVSWLCDQVCLRLLNFLEGGL